MSSKERQISNNSEKQKSKKPIIENSAIKAQEQILPAITIQRASLDPSTLTPCEVQQLQRAIGNRAVGQLLAGAGPRPVIQAKADAPGAAAAPVAATQPNRTGLPDALKAGVETLSGYSMDAVRVHYNSDKPAKVQALAYTQGTDIHVAPGQEGNLPHETWHVVQQAQGRVPATMQMKGVGVNDDAGLEREAEVMGVRAKNARALHRPGHPVASTLAPAPIQAKWATPNSLPKGDIEVLKKLARAFVGMETIRSHHITSLRTDNQKTYGSLWDIGIALKLTPKKPDWLEGTWCEAGVGRFRHSSGSQPQDWNYYGTIEYSLIEDKYIWRPGSDDRPDERYETFADAKAAHTTNITTMGPGKGEDVQVPAGVPVRPPAHQKEIIPSPFAQNQASPSGQPRSPEKKMGEGETGQGRAQKATGAQGEVGGLTVEDFKIPKDPITDKPVFPGITWMIAHLNGGPAFKLFAGQDYLSKEKSEAYQKDRAQIEVKREEILIYKAFDAHKIETKEGELEPRTVSDGHHRLIWSLYHTGGGPVQVKLGKQSSGGQNWSNVFYKKDPKSK